METLVAVSIVLIVIVGPMTLSSRTTKSSTFATEQVQAYFLAQEGLELVQKARDEYMLEYFDGSESNPWSTFRTDYATCFGATGCGLVWHSSPGNLSNPINCSGTASSSTYQVMVVAIILTALPVMTIPLLLERFFSRQTWVTRLFWIEKSMFVLK